MEYSIKRFDSKDLYSLAKLLKVCFTFKSKNELNALKWKYDPEDFPRKKYAWIAQNADKEIISHYANIELVTIKNGKLINSLLCIDMATHPQYRGKGLISKLSQKVYEDVLKSSAIFSIGFSNDQGVLVDRNAKGYGYVVVGAFSKYIKIVIRQTKSSLQWEPVLTFDSTNHWQEDNHYQLDKSLNYLNWRYVQRPDNHYNIYKVRFERQNGYIVLRYHDFRVDVLDLINIPSEQMSDCFQLMEVIAQSKKKKAVVLNVLENEYWKTLLKKEGYLKQPINKENFYLTIKVHKPQKIDTNELLDKNNWKLLGGDIW